MKKTILTAASILAITLSGAAYAEDNVPNTGNVLTDAKAELKADWADAKAKADAKLDANTENQNADANVNASANADANSTLENVKESAKEDWAAAKEKIQETTDNIQANAEGDWEHAKATTKENYQDAKAKLFGEGDAGAAPTSLDVKARTSAAGMIGKPIYNSNKEKIGSVSDIIVDHNGNAQLVVVSDGGFAGIGDKLAAFDYGLVVSQNAEGDVFMPLTEDLVKKVAAFSYDPKDAGENVRLIPSDGYSVAQLLKANLEDPNGKNIAKVENITFDNGEAKNVIVAFDQMLGMGGEKAAFDFDDVQILRKSADDVNVRLNARQSAEFEAFKDQKTN